MPDKVALCTKNDSDKNPANGKSGQYSKDLPDGQYSKDLPDGQHLWPAENGVGWRKVTSAETLHLNGQSKWEKVL